MPDQIELSPWPMNVTVAPDVIVTVEGISANSYVFGSVGLVSPTTANEANVEAELPALFTAFKLANP